MISRNKIKNLTGIFDTSGNDNLNRLTSRQLTVLLAKQLHRPLIFPPVPGFLLKILLGEMAEMVLYGSRVSCEKILKEGFRFRYDTAGEALGNIFR